MLTGLSGKARKIIIGLAITYSLMIAYLCFSIQPFLITGVTTPNIIYWGRLRLLLVPFNSFVSAGLGSLTIPWQLFWIMGQNISNIFLLYPLGLCLMLLTNRWASWKKSLVLGFSISLFIETTQLLLDLLIDANRVFEIDDLWTNSLGMLLAYLSVKIWKKFILKSIK